MKAYLLKLNEKTEKLEILEERVCLTSSTNYLLFEDTMIRYTYGKYFDRVASHAMDEIYERKGYFTNCELDIRHLVRINRETYTAKKTVAAMASEILNLEKNEDSELSKIALSMKEYAIITIKPLREQGLVKTQQFMLLYV